MGRVSFHGVYLSLGRWADHRVSPLPCPIGYIEDPQLVRHVFPAGFQFSTKHVDIILNTGRHLFSKLKNVLISKRAINVPLGQACVCFKLHNFKLFSCCCFKIVLCLLQHSVTQRNKHFLLESNLFFSETTFDCFSSHFSQIFLPPSHCCGFLNLCVFTWQAASEWPYLGTGPLLMGTVFQMPLSRL